MAKIPKWIYTYKVLLERHDEEEPEWRNRKAIQRGFYIDNLALAIVTVLLRHKHGHIMQEVE